MPCTSTSLGTSRIGVAARPATGRRLAAARRTGGLAVRAFGPGNELKDGVEEGTRVKVTAPIKVYHVPKTPELNIEGMTGTVAEVVKFYKGVELSATQPYRVQLDMPTPADGKKAPKVFVHLAGDEIDIV